MRGFNMRGIGPRSESRIAFSFHVPIKPSYHRAFVPTIAGTKNRKIKQINSFFFSILGEHYVGSFGTRFRRQ